MKKLFLAPLIIVLLSSLIFGGCAAPAPAPTPTPAPAKPIVLKSISALPPFVTNCSPLFELIGKVNERAKGELVIEYLGGEEVVAIPDQAMAVRKGVVDMSMTFATAYEGLLPGVSVCFSLSKLYPWEEREVGVVDYVQEFYHDIGLHYLGRGFVMEKPGAFFSTWTVPKVETPADLAGLRIGGISPLYNDFETALGVVPKLLPIADLYTAIERGVIDGLWIAFTDPLEMGLAPILPYMIDHLYGSDDNTFLINLDVWNRLPKHLQDLMTESMIEVEYERVEFAKGIWPKWYDGYRDAGMEFIKFSPEDAKYYVDLSFSSRWDAEMAKYPEVVGKLKALLTK